MGLLDQLGNLSPEQTQGLLAASAQMLQQSGPSRVPVSFGQTLGTGIGAFQESMAAAQRRKLEEEAARQAATLRGLQIQEAQGGMADKERARQEADRLRQFYVNRQVGAGPEAPQMPNVATPDLSSAPQQSRPGMMPAGLQAPLPQRVATDPYHQRMAEADALRSAGFHAQADAAEAAALKFKPEFSQTPQTGIGPDGKPFQYVLDKEGNPKRLEGVLPRDKLELANIGGSDIAYNPYALKVGQTFQRTMTPVESARLNFDIGQVNRPIFNAEAGGFITPPSKKSPQGTITPLAGFIRPDKPLTESQGKATNFAARMTESDALVKKFENSGISGNAFSTLAAASPLTNWAASEEGQMYRQAQENFVTANLRQESGAAIPKDEMNKEIRKYFPVVGDQPGVIAQKARAREIATKGMLVQAGPGAKSIMGIVGGEPAVAPEAKPAPAAASKEFSMLPNASEFDGKRMKSSDGTIYRSSGGKWVKE